MGSLYGLLVSQEIIKKIPMALVVWYSLILILAFSIGFIKGFRRVAWGGFYWVFASVSFFIVHKALAAKNPIASILKGKNEGAVAFAWTAILLVGCIAVSLIMYGCLSVILRPKEVEIAEEEGEEVDEYGFVYEDETEDDEDLKKAPTLYIKHGGKPSWFARLAGGFLVTVNVAVVLAVVTSLFLLVVGQTSVRDGSWGILFNSALIKKVEALALSYAFDFFTIGIIILIAYKGYDVGFVGSMHAIAIVLGLLFIDELAFVLPFTKTDAPFISTLVDRCANLFTSFKPDVGLVLGKITAGLILVLAGVVLLSIIIFLLRKTREAVEAHKTSLILDEVVAVGIYLIIGALVAMSIWSVLYLLDYCGIFYVTKAFNEDASLSGEFFQLAEEYLKDFADNHLLKFRAK